MLKGSNACLAVLILSGVDFFFSPLVVSLFSYSTRSPLFRISSHSTVSVRTNSLHLFDKRSGEIVHVIGPHNKDHVTYRLTHAVKLANHQRAATKTEGAEETQEHKPVSKQEADEKGDEIVKEESESAVKQEESGVVVIGDEDAESDGRVVTVFVDAIRLKHDSQDMVYLIPSTSSSSSSSSSSDVLAWNEEGYAVSVGEDGVVQVHSNLASEAAVKKEREAEADSAVKQETEGERDGQPDEGVKQEEQPKRKRGRPRRSQVPEEVATDDGTTTKGRRRRSATKAIKGVESDVGEEDEEGEEIASTPRTSFKIEMPRWVRVMSMTVNRVFSRRLQVAIRVSPL